jgi:hypothetical protein
MILQRYEEFASWSVRVGEFVDDNYPLIFARKLEAGRRK